MPAMSCLGLQPCWSKQEPRSRSGAAATNSARTRSRLEVRRTHALATAARNFLRSPESAAGAAEDSAPPPAAASPTADPGAPPRRALQPRALAGGAAGGGAATSNEHQADAEVAEVPAAGGHRSSSPQHSAVPGRQSLQPEPATSGSGGRGEDAAQQGDSRVHAPATRSPSAAQHGAPRRSRESVRRTHALAHAARSVMALPPAQSSFAAERPEWLVSNMQQRRRHSGLWLDPVC